MRTEIILTYYDLLIAKLIVHAENRKPAIIRMKRALDEFIIEGIKTTIPFHLRVLNHGDFQKQVFCRGFEVVFNRGAICMFRQIA